MRLRAGAIALLVLSAGALAVWHELYPVARPGEGARPLLLLPASRRTQAELDVVLPAVPAGVQRLAAGRGALIVHYWAPWERHARDQARLLDSLRRDPAMQEVRVALVCFDPFPSVARFVARQRLRLAVLLDADKDLRSALPCPSIPYTYVLDRGGRIVIAQPGEVDWWSPETRRSLLHALNAPVSAGRRFGSTARPGAAAAPRRS